MSITHTITTVQLHNTGAHEAVTGVIQRKLNILSTSETFKSEEKDLY